VRVAVTGNHFSIVFSGQRCGAVTSVYFWITFNVAKVPSLVKATQANEKRAAGSVAPQVEEAW
jgi:hypothetical protein